MRSHNNFDAYLQLHKTFSQYSVRKKADTNNYSKISLSSNNNAMRLLKDWELRHSEPNIRISLGNFCGKTRPLLHGL